MSGRGISASGLAAAPATVGNLQTFICESVRMAQWAGTRFLICTIIHTCTFPMWWIKIRLLLLCNCALSTWAESRNEIINQSGEELYCHQSDPENDHLHLFLRAALARNLLALITGCWASNVSRLGAGWELMDIRKRSSFSWDVSRSPVSRRAAEWLVQCSASSLAPPPSPTPWLHLLVWFGSCSGWTQVGVELALCWTF